MRENPGENQSEYDLICIGCGPAGEKAATQAAYFGHRVAIVEREVRPGGAMVNTGTIPSKALRETALLCSAFHRRPLPGMNFSIDHALSVNKFMARRHLIEHQEHDRIEQSFDRQGISVYRGSGRLRDPHTVEISTPDSKQRYIRGRFILIATGSSPLRPDHVPFDHPCVVDADGVLELQHMPRSMIIVGGGVIGCEYASVFAEIDVKVTLIHTGDAILSFLDPELREHLTAAMREKDIDIMLEQRVRAVHPLDDHTIEVELASGRRITAATLLWAAGRQSNTRDLGLEEVGVALGERGMIDVNDHFQTSVPSIYAAGDVIGFPALAATSMEQGRVAACHMFDIDFKTRLADITPIGIYTIPPVSMIGLSITEARARGIAVVIGRAEYRNNVRGRMLGDEQGILKCLFDRNTHQLLGTAIVGEEATELIHLAKSVIDFGGGIDHFINACYNYPSLTELYKYAAYSALQAMARYGQPRTGSQPTTGLAA
jgi:NAD(P) transhydrogenase